MLAVCLLVVQAPPETLEQLRARADRTLEQSRVARAAGDKAAADRLMGEAAWLTSQVAEAEGDFPRATQHAETAARYGYAPAPPPPAPPPPPQDTLFHHEAWLASDALWDLYGLGPYPSSRNHGFHGLVNVPPLESAMTLPEFSFAFDTRYHYDSADLSDSSEGGLSSFDSERGILSSQFDYGLTPAIQLGLRTSAGEVNAGSRGRSTLFDDGTQLLRRGTRDLSIESAVFRLKSHYDVSEFLETGLLMEVKIPLDGRFDLLTADSIDVGLSALASRRWGPVVLHANLGGVFPIGEAEDIFRANDELQPAVTGGVAAVWDLGRVSLGLQAEGNTSPFAEIDLLKDPVGQVLLFGTFELNRNVYVSAAGGVGIGEFSSDFTGSVGITFAY